MRAAPPDTERALSTLPEAGEFSVVPSDDPKQAVRIHRFFLAAGTYLLNTLLVCCLFGWLGFIDPRVILNGGVAVVLINVAFYSLLRSGLNRKLRDPSLTVPQILAAVLLLMYLAYHAQEARGVLVLLAFMAVTFGLFRLRTATFLLVVLFAVCAYGVVIVLLAYQSPHQIKIRLEVLQWGTLLVVLPWFGLMGHYISSIQNRLRKSNAELNAALATVQELAIHDELTGAYNRRYFMEAIRKEAQRWHRGG